MIHNGNDQAAGLRRLLVGGAGRIVAIQSAAPADELSGLLLNLASAFGSVGRDVLVVDADRRTGRAALALGVEAAPTLLDAASGICTVDEAVRRSPHGFEVAVLTPPGALVAPGRIGRLDGVLRRASDRADITLVGMSMRSDQGWSLPCLARGDVIVQIANTRASITGAYRLIKHITTRVGRRPFSILVTDATPQQALIAGGNVSRAAERYLAVPVNPIGAIPADEHLGRAALLGRSVLDAYPRSTAAGAYRHLAVVLTQPPRGRGAVAAGRSAAPSVNAEFGL